MAVLTSIKPKYCDLIFSGKKTIELRKTKPKCGAPFKCYVYETKGLCDVPRFVDEDGHVDYHGSGMVIGEFICDNISDFTAEFVDDDDLCYEDIRFHYLDSDGEDETIVISTNEYDNPSDCWLCKESCLSFNEIKKYIGYTFHDKQFSGWHITKANRYDTPKALSDFCSLGYYNKNGIWIRKNPHAFTRPPQSWCYCEELT